MRDICNRCGEFVPELKVRLTHTEDGKEIVWCSPCFRKMREGG